MIIRTTVCGVAMEAALSELLYMKTRKNFRIRIRISGLEWERPYDQMLLDEIQRHCDGG